MKILLEKVTKSFMKVQVLKEINLDVKDGEFVAFLGPSGCGKTTTLLLIAGIYKPTSGLIKFDDIVVNRVVPKNRQIGMVFQSYALYSHMNVYQNLVFSLMLQKRPKSEMQKAAQETADMMGIGHLLHRKVGMLSGGQQQRVALGRALIKKPKLLLFDEPLSNLDARLRISMRSEIKKLQKKLGITSIYVTHDQVEAMTMADRVAVMKDGFMQAYDTPQNLHDRPKTMFIGGFVGNPPMNFIDVKLKSQNNELYACFGDGIKLAIQKKRYPKKRCKNNVLGIRPQDIIPFPEKGKKELFKITLVERLGRDNLVVCNRGDLQVTTLVDAEIKLVEETDIELGFDMEKVQFFDKDTKRSILWL